MVSSKFVGISSRGYVKSMTSSKGSSIIGGDIPILLNKIIKEPIKGGALEEEGMSNRIVGIITKGTEPTGPAVPLERIKRGGELINNLQNIRFIID